MKSLDKDLILAFGTGIAAALFFLAGCMHFGIEPIWIVPALAAAAAGLVIVRKWPLVPIAGLLFVGAFKSTPAQGITFSDPTMIVFLLAVGAIGIELLLVISDSSRFSLHDLFAGQGLGVALFLLFATVLALSYLYSPAPAYGGEKLFHFWTFQTVVFFAPLILVRREKDLEQLLFAFFLLGLALAVKEVYVFLHPTKAILSGDKDITHIGDAQLIGMSLLIFFYAQPFRRFPKTLAVPVLGMGLVACAARGPLLSMLVVMVVYSFAVRKSSGFVSYKQILVGLGIVAIVIAFAISWMQRYPAAHDKIAEKKQELKSLVSGSQDPGGTTQQRFEFYRSALSAFSKEPLLGTGLGGWAFFYYGYEKADYPHNIVLEVAAEQGVLGLTALLAFFGAVWLASRRIWERQPELAFAIPLYVYSVLVCMFSGDLNVRALWFWSGAIFALNRMCCFRTPRKNHFRQASPCPLPEPVPHEWAVIPQFNRS